MNGTVPNGSLFFNNSREFRENNSQKLLDLISKYKSIDYATNVCNQLSDKALNEFDNIFSDLPDTRARLLLINITTDDQAFWLDMNQDGLLNVQDVVELISVILAINDEAEYTDEEWEDLLVRGDVNQDGGLNISDVIVLINMVLDT